MVDPIRPAGGLAPAVGVPASRTAAPSGPAFSDRLRKTIRPEAPGAVPADPRLAEIQRYAARSLGTEAWEARLLETYDALSADEALYEVQTSKGPFQVIRSRMGELSIYPAR